MVFCRVTNRSGGTSTCVRNVLVYSSKEGDFYKVGDEIEAKILTLDREERKMSLELNNFLKILGQILIKSILLIQNTLLRLETLQILVCLLN